MPGSRRTRTVPITYAAAVLAAVLAVLALETSAHAQLISGRVVVDGEGTGIDAATLELIDSLGARRAGAITDSVGSFRIMAPVAGSYRLRVEHIGYAPLETVRVQATIGIHIELELKLSPTAVALEPLRVVGQSAYSAGWLQEYYDRAIWTRRSGTGRVFFRDEVERARVPVSSSFLMYLLPRGSCRPSIFVDGLPLQDADHLDSSLRPELIEGVELYNNAAFFPFRYQNRGHCAIALFWTRRDVEARGPVRWLRVLIGAGVLGLLALLTQI